MKKRVLIILAVVLCIGVIVTIGLYIGDANTRSWFNKYIFRKDIEESSLPYVRLEEENNPNIYAYGDNVAIVEDNVLKIYDKSAKVKASINVSITEAKFASVGKYLLLADKDKSNLYLICDTELQWSKTVDGNISQITVNENGWIAVALSGTTYKTVIAMYNISGEETLKTYLSSTYVTDMTISNDNKYLSFAEANTSGTVIESTIKTVSIEKAKTNPNEAIIYKYSTSQDSLIVKIKYDKDKLVAYTDKGVYIYNKDNEEEIYQIGDNTSFVDISLKNCIAYIGESSKNMKNSDNTICFKNTENKSLKTYYLKGAVKGLYCKKDLAVINFGNEIEVINTGASLIKRFDTTQNVKDIVLGEGVVGIVYKNRVEILGL